LIAYNNFEIHKYDSKLEEKNQKRESKLRERKAMARQGLIDKDAINDISVTEEGSVEENADKRKVFELLVDEKQKKALKQAKITNKFINYLEAEKFSENVLNVQEKLGEMALNDGFKNFQNIQHPESQAFAK